MSAVANLIIISLIQIVSNNFIISKLEKTKVRYTKINVTIMTIMTIGVALLNFYQNSFYKTVLMVIMFVFGYKYIFRITINSSIINIFIVLITNAISEFILLIITVIILRIPQQFLVEHVQIKPLICLISFVIIVLIFKLLGDKIAKIKEAMEKRKKIIYSIYIACSLGIGILFSKNANNLTNNVDFIMNTFTILVFLTIIFLLIKEIVDKSNKKKEYDNLFNYLVNIESLFEKYQKYNHENKNQLIYIKNLATENKEIEEFVDSILSENIPTNSLWIRELTKIPNGGLKGFLSYKINKMIDKGIKVSISISPRVSNFKIKSEDKKFQKNLCRIIGVYIDNAYEASKESKDKEVTIEMFVSGEELSIIISNTYKGKIELENIDRVGYSTKGKGRGVGLALVHDIMENNNNIRQERRLMKNIYYQFIYIKNKG